MAITDRNASFHRTFEDTQETAPTKMGMRILSLNQDWIWEILSLSINRWSEQHHSYLANLKCTHNLEICTHKQENIREYCTIRIHMKHSGENTQHHISDCNNNEINIIARIIDLQTYWNVCYITTEHTQTHTHSIIIRYLYVIQYMICYPF